MPSKATPGPGAAAEIVARAEAAPPRLGRSRLVCIDGLAGAGKSTLATAVGVLRPDAVVLATDEMLHGWSGLPDLGATLDRLLRPLAGGRSGTWRRWDWIADAWAEEHRVDPVDLLVLEGVGSAADEIADLVSLTVWVEAERDVRRRRWVDRDGEALEGYWSTWSADEAAHHRVHRARERAELCFDTTGGRAKLRDGGPRPGP